MDDEIRGAFFLVRAEPRAPARGTPETAQLPAGATGLVRLTVTIDGVAVEQELWILVE